MNNYFGNITEHRDGTFYALVMRKDDDGECFVCRSYMGRTFKTAKAALKSTLIHIEKLNA